MRTNTLRCLFVLAAISAACLCGTPAQADLPQIKLTTIVPQGTLQSPVGMANAGDSRLFVIDQRGKIQIISGGSLLGTPFLDIGTKLVTERAGFDERGLLGLAFHPNYANTGKFYVYYSAPDNSAGVVDHKSVVAEYTVSGDPNIANAASERVLMTFTQPQFNHDGGQLSFGLDG